MKKLFFLLLICNLSIAQTNSKESSKLTGAQKTIVAANCKDVASYAKKDIKNKQISIFVQGGIAPMVYKADPIFEKKHNIKYIDLGCIGNEYAETYNQTIFEYLTKTFGKSWTINVNKNVVGLSKWQANQKNLIARND